jgi:hypothetical protein
MQAPLRRDAGLAGLVADIDGPVAHDRRLADHVPGVVAQIISGTGVVVNAKRRRGCASPAFVVCG